jgi:hypothetical protein
VFVVDSCIFRRMPSTTTSRKFHELIPIVSLFIAAVPELLQVMEDWLSLMITAGVIIILVIKIVLSTALVDTSKLALLSPEQFLLLFVLLSLLLFLLLLQI